MDTERYGVANPSTFTSLNTPPNQMQMWPTSLYDIVLDFTDKFCWVCYSVVTCVNGLIDLLGIQCIVTFFFCYIYIYIFFFFASLC